MNLWLIKLPKPEKAWLWLLITLGFKAILVYFFTFHQAHQNVAYNCLAKITNDSVSYIEPFESLYRYGSYNPDFRMPGYGWVYFLLRYLLPQDWALNCIVGLQLALSSISVYYLALTGRSVFKSQRLFYFIFFSYLLSHTVTYNDSYILTESFTVSALIFSIYFLVKSKRNKWDVLLSGAFLTWAIFMRPVVLPLILIYVISLFVSKERGNSLPSKFKLCFIFILPFMLIESPWIIRNYCKYDRVFILTKTTYVPSINDSYHKSVMQFAQAVGVSQVGWEPNSVINFFKPEKTFAIKKPIVFSNEIYTSKFNYDSLVSIRNLIIRYQNMTGDNAEKKAIDATISARMNSYIESIRNEKPWLYYVKSRFNASSLFFGHTGVYNLFNRMTLDLNKVEVSIKAFYALLYIYTVLVGLCSLIFIFTRNIRFMNDKLLLTCIGLYLALIHPMGLKMEEYRYIVSAFPFLVVFSMVFTDWFVRTSHEKWQEFRVKK
jgi:hypothetical protein